MRRINERLAKLEADADHADGKHNMRVFMLADDEALPEGVNPDDDDVMVVRFVSVVPVYDERGSVIPPRPRPQFLAAGAGRG